MSPDDLLEYAGVVVGFPIKPHQAVYITEEQMGVIDGEDEMCVSEKGALALITEISLEPHPRGLTVRTEILIDGARDLYMPVCFDEGNSDVFPFERLKTPEEAEAQAKKDAEQRLATAVDTRRQAEAAGHTAGQEAARNAARANPHSIEEDWGSYLDGGYCC